MAVGLEPEEVGEEPDVVSGWLSEAEAVKDPLGEAAGVEVSVTEEVMVAAAPWARTPVPPRMGRRAKRIPPKRMGKTRRRRLGMPLFRFCLDGDGDRDRRLAWPSSDVSAADDDPGAGAGAPVAMAISRISARATGTAGWPKGAL